MFHQTNERYVIDALALAELFTALQRRDYQLVGPTIRNGAIVYDELASPADLPVGWTDEQDGGTYRLKNRGDAALFGYAVGPHSWKQFLHPPVLPLSRATQDQQAPRFSGASKEVPRYAFIGVRSCELHAIAIQDRIFMGGARVDPTYRARRENAFILAVNCGHAAGTCFCVSMETGPQAMSGFDLAITELLDADRHAFAVDVGTELGASVLEEVPYRSILPVESEAAQKVVETTAKHMGRTMDTTEIRELFYANLEHSRWDDVASRCLTCGNCTMVCPTCFCFTVEDVTDLTGTTANRVRRWDSCFTTDFTYTAGKPIRPSGKARYRQWLTHKLATWIDQFGTSGCVGCGRCITWCPVGIDITEEVAAIRGVAPEEETHP